MIECFELFVARFATGGFPKRVQSGFPDASPGVCVRVHFLSECPECAGTQVAAQDVIDRGRDNQGLHMRLDPPAPRGLHKAGLVLNTLSGHVAGKLVPGHEVPEKLYKITASNAVGSASAKLLFAVREPVPLSLLYHSVTRECVTGDRVRLEHG